MKSLYLIIKKKPSEFIKYKQVLKNITTLFRRTVKLSAFYLSELRIDNAAILLIAITGCQEAGQQCHQVIGDTGDGFILLTFNKQQMMILSAGIVIYHPYSGY